MGKIKFGTDGWRAIMCDEFIFHNIKIVVQGVAEYLKSRNLASKGVLIGYDSRFFSDRFAQLAGEVLGKNQIPFKITKTDVPTPVLAFALTQEPCAGGIVFTASHNPPAYNGIKFIPNDGAPAMPEVTDVIEAKIAEIGDREVETLSLEEAKKAGLYGELDVTQAYLKHLHTLVDTEKIKDGRLRIVYDSMYGQGRNYVPAMLSQACDFTALHGKSDPYFGGLSPEPIAQNLQELSEAVRDKAHLGLANDGDADRFGVVDFDGSYISANQVLALLLYHLLKNRGLRGPVARSVATTHLLDEIAKSYDLPVIETPVGFKYIGRAILEQGVIMGGEESGGMSMIGHIPEKDGILAVSLITELRATEGKSLKVLLEELGKKYGQFVSKRVDMHCSPADKERLVYLQQLSQPNFLGGLRVMEKKTIDGLKFILEDGSWVLYRASGTENLVRIYLETHDADQLAPLEQAAVSFFYSSCS